MYCPIIVTDEVTRDRYILHIGESMYVHIDQLVIDR